MANHATPSHRATPFPVDVAVHPCPTPRIRARKAADGTLWACRCGEVYVLRNDWNYAGDVWRWKRALLRIQEDNL